MNINVRVPEQNWGDLNAQFAQVNVGERKVHEIIERFGLDTFKAAQRELLDYAETQARAIVRDIPDGEYFFAEYADEDSDGGLPCRIAITLRVQGETLELDYTGSDPQLSSSLNMPTGGRERHVLTMVGLGYVLYTLNPNLLLNAGVLRVARAILPKGTVVNCEPPAAVGMRSLTCVITQLCTFGAFARAVPDRMAASPAGSVSIMNVKTTDKLGRPVMASLGPVGVSTEYSQCHGSSKVVSELPLVFNALRGLRCTSDCLLAGPCNGNCISGHVSSDVSDRQAVFLGKYRKSLWHSRVRTCGYSKAWLEWLAHVACGAFFIDRVMAASSQFKDASCNRTQLPVCRNPVDDSASVSQNRCFC